jgi:hypothetical protein
MKVKVGNSINKESEIYYIIAKCPPFHVLHSACPKRGAVVKRERERKKEKVRKKTKKKLSKQM